MSHVDRQLDPRAYQSALAMTEQNAYHAIYEQAEQTSAAKWRKPRSFGVLWKTLLGPASHRSFAHIIHRFQRGIIRQHQLDLVKCYAAEFCGVKALREAMREQVGNFVTHVSEWGEKDRTALPFQLNSYLGSKEGAA